MSNIFEDDSDSDVDIKTNNDYAKNYDVWRKKEELNKLRTKYGEDIDLDADFSSSSSDDEDGVELTETIEKDFFKTLACLKNKDPRIYDEKVNFFQHKDDNVSIKAKKKKKDEPVYLKDYERNIILEKGGILSDEESDSENRPKSPTYVEEQKRIKDSLKNALSAIDDEEEDTRWGGLFEERKKTEEEKEKEDSDYIKWLAGEKTKIGNKEFEKELKPLKDYWNDSNLDEGEKFLRDYILEKKFLDKDQDDYIPTYDEIIHDSDQDLSNDEKHIEEQEEFEHKYNFRFEEPDQEFIKRYPRIMENSVRKVDDRRKLKRMETKERKKKEKEAKMQELKKMQEFKRKEIEEKLEKLKEITGNADIGFADEDIDGDFDPEAHDKRMQNLFNDEFYQGPGEEQKPEFPDIDEELEIENWERYDLENGNTNDLVPHCEDENFNMDCDYDPHTTQNELIESSRRKKKRRRKSKFAEALTKPKPKFDPNDKNYEKYFDEYYKLDCEDIIGDIPCRFKYRQVVPNDFGLSIEEILLAKERELNKWCSLKKAVQIRPDHIEKYDQIAYKKKSLNLNLKKKILPSLFTADSEEDANHKESGSNNIEIGEKTYSEEKETKQFNDRTISNSNEQISGNELTTVNVSEDNAQGNSVNNTNKKKKKKKVKQDQGLVRNNANEEINIKDKSASNVYVEEKLSKDRKNVESVEIKSQIKRKNKRPYSDAQNDKIHIPRKKIKKTKQKRDSKDKCSISDARLSAYGINPKKYKNKLKYSNNK